MTEPGVKKDLRLSISVALVLLIIASFTIYHWKTLRESISFFAGGALLIGLAFLTGETVEAVLRDSARKKVIAMFLLKIIIAALVLAVLIHYKFPLIFTASGTGFVAFLLSIMLIFHNQKGGK